MARPVSIRRSLLLHLLVGIMALSGAIMAVTFLASRHAAATLSRSLITQTLNHTESQLRQFFDPVTASLQIARQWGQSGLLNTDDPEQLNPLFVPLMIRCPQVSSLLVADSRGREYMLLRTPEKWINRRTRCDEWGARSRWLEWTEEDPSPVATWRELNYDPRTRPWYRGALDRRERSAARSITTADESATFWTEPYTFFTTKDPGITASVTFEVGDGLDHVIGFDVLLNDISRFTTGLQVSREGKVIVMTDDGRIIGLPRIERFLTEDGRRAALLKQPEELGIELATNATGAFMDHPDDDDPLRFHSGGEPWWGAARTFQLAPQRTLWIAVVVPESDLLGGVTELRWGITVITIAVLGAAILRAVTLAKRYSRPIEALMRESERISGLDLEPGPAIESNVKEVRHLAEAHERMRSSLQSLLKIERDLQLARQIQQRTFPNQLPTLGGFDIDALSEPAEETGGDTYDVVGFQSAPAGEPIVLTAGNADRALLLLADATGHGIGPALSVAQVRAMLRMAVRMNEDLATIILHMNDQLCADLPAGRFITAWLGELNASDRTLRSFSAGQGPLLRYDAARDEFDAPPTDAPPFGIISDLKVSVGEPIVMRPGDIFAVISDGFFEAAETHGELFGTRRVEEVLRANRRRSSAEILAALREAVRTFSRGAPATDDRTAIIVKGR